jgi:hypothetical protein
VTTVRCPSCDAAVPSEASWCSLCFAPLSVAAAPAVAPAPVVPAQPESVVTPVDPWVAAEIAAAPVAYEPVACQPVAYEPLPLPPAPVLEAPAAPVAPAAQPMVAEAPAPVATAVATVDTPTWPCSTCDARVDLAEAACPGCGTPFMGGANGDVSLKVPGVGDLVHMSAGTKFGVMAGGAVGISMVLVLLFLVLGHIF